MVSTAIGDWLYKKMEAISLVTGIILLLPINLYFGTVEEDKILCKNYQKYNTSLLLADNILIVHTLPKKFTKIGQTQTNAIKKQGWLNKIGR